MKQKISRKIVGKSFFTSRKGQAVVVLFFLFILLSYVFAQYPGKDRIRYRITFYDVFDTQTEIIGYGKSERIFSQEAQKLYAQLLYYHKLLDIYNEYEGMVNMKTINDSAGTSPVTVEPELLEFLQFAKEMYRLTKGETNIAMGSVLKIWHDYRQQGNEQPQKAQLPQMEELKMAFQHTDIENLVLDEDSCTVYLKDPQMCLDVGSLGKGYAAEKVAEYAKNQGISGILMNLGGNIRTIGVPKEGELWQLGIQNPDLSSQETYIETVQIPEGSLVTSGSYQRYYTVDGKQYCHIIDKDTLMPAEYVVSVTVLTEDAALADVLSTALFNMPVEEGQEWLQGLKDVEAMWILSDGTQLYSQGFRQYQRKKQ